ncbi:hypothetical protein ACKUB1_17830 [Methanospirillum stamsii]|uniref:Terminase n=1 Tax=Methanospirillum stamsii TaxID=1277351 RepID=A0A2V2MYY4_9EURY|nr:terminase [Methanospirillum stamsii]PWR73354.1 terminase [Methanospirillum stamsii]
MVKEMIEHTPGGDGIILNLHPGQLRAMNSEKRFVAMLSGTQGGKTSLGPFWLAREIETRGPGDYLAISADYDMFKLKMLPEMLKVFEQTLQIGRYHPSVKVLEIRDPNTGEFWAEKADDEMYARIILRSAVAGKNETGVKGLESTTAKAAWMDEAGLPEVSLVAFEAVQRRLSLFQGRVLLTSTLYDFGWLRTHVYLPWLNGDPDIDIIRFDSIENPKFPKEEYERAKRKLPSWKFDLQYRGIWTRPAGQIYSDLDESVHVVTPFDIPDHWPVIVGIDFGAVHQALIWISQDPQSGKYYVFDESLEGEMSTKGHCRKAKDKAANHRRVIWYGGAASEKQQRFDWQAEGINVHQPPISDVESGIDRVTELIKTDRLFFFRTCEKTVSQVIEYSRKVNALGEVTEEIKDKSAYHMADALRYAVSGIDSLNVKQISHPSPNDKKFSSGSSRFSFNIQKGRFSGW